MPSEQEQCILSAICTLQVLARALKPLVNKCVMEADSSNLKLAESLELIRRSAGPFPQFSQYYLTYKGHQFVQSVENLSKTVEGRVGY
jgi:DNA-binding HxlR family transcriptional regulator